MESEHKILMESRGKIKSKCKAFFSYIGTKLNSFRANYLSAALPNVSFSNNGLGSTVGTSK